VNALAKSIELITKARGYECEQDIEEKLGG